MSVELISPLEIRSIRSVCNQDQLINTLKQKYLHRPKTHISAQISEQISPDDPSVDKMVSVSRELV